MHVRTTISAVQKRDGETETREHRGGKRDECIEAVRERERGGGEGRARAREITRDARGTASCTARRTEIESGRPTGPLT